MTIPGYWASKMAEIPPRNRPSRKAYIGAVKAAHCFLNIVIRATMNPPKAPPNTHGITVAGFPEV